MYSKLMKFEAYHFHFLLNRNITFTFIKRQGQGARAAIQPFLHKTLSLAPSLKPMGCDANSRVQTELQKIVLHSNFLNIVFFYALLYNCTIIQLYLMADITYSIYMGWHRTTSKPQSDDCYLLSGSNASQPWCWWCSSWSWSRWWWSSWSWSWPENLNQNTVIRL